MASPPTTRLFTPALSEQLPGDDWLRHRRIGAAEAAADLELPSAELEEWRYSRIGDLPAGSFVPVSGGPHDGTLPSEVTEVLEALGEHCGHVVTVDGAIAAHMGCAEAETAGVTFGQAVDGSLLGSVMRAAPDAFVAWNDALVTAPVVLDVPRGVQLARPFVVVHHVASAGSAVFPRLVVRAGADSSFAVIEVLCSDDVPALVVPVTEIAVGPAARVRHSVVQELGPRVWQVGALFSEVGQEATFASGVAAFGGEYARLRIDCRLVGRGAAGNVAAAYLGGGAQMIDLRTFQEHGAADTTSDLYFKGAVAERSHSVYTGLIHIDPEGRGSDAVQANRVVKLSDDAWAESVPNLEIENNDVRCAHASTVGPVDPEQRYYLESRGIPPGAAERLVVGGFFDDALAHFPVPEVVPLVGSRIDAELDRDLTALDRNAPASSAR